MLGFLINIMLNNFIYQNNDVRVFDKYEFK